MKLKVKMWSLAVQCKAIATLVIIAGMLDTSDLAELIPPHKVGKNPLIFKQVSDKSFKKIFCMWTNLKRTLC